MRQRDVAVVAFLVLCLYLPFRSIQYDLNGLVEAWAVQNGYLFSKNHLLYRPVGYLLYRALEYCGFTGTPLAVLQVWNGLFGAIGVALAYLVFKRQTNDWRAAALGSFWLGTSFTYWFFSTDVAYITLAGMFAIAAVACLSYASSTRWIAGAALFTSLSILTWQASLFLVPVCLLFFWVERRQPRQILTFITSVVLISGICYGAVAAVMGNVRRPTQFLHWFLTYGEGSTLPVWGTWSRDRIGELSISALRSIVPIQFGLWPSEISTSVQRGRILVDLACIGLLVLLVLAASKLQFRSIWFLAGYLGFIPFIAWWDPFEPKWFLIPNIFLAGFLATGLTRWIDQTKLRGSIVIGCALVIAAANFVTTIRPRHSQLGTERMTAKCVSDHMQQQDGFISAEWGWPEYLAYFHSRTTINLINETVYARTKERMMTNVKDFIAAKQAAGANVYLQDPRQYAGDHLSWLNAQTHVTLEDLIAFGGEHAFECSGRVIQKVPLLR